MARPTVRLPGTTRLASGVLQGTRSGVDLSGGMADTVARGLATVGEALVNVREAQFEQDRVALAIEEERKARDEEDARLYTASAMARARARASEIARQQQEQAGDGWRGLTDNVEKAWGSYFQEELQAAPNDWTRNYLQLEFDQLTPTVLDNVAELESRGRLSWQVDVTRNTIRDASNLVMSDPNSYEPVRTDLMNGLSGIRDADTRRDLASEMEEELALAAGTASVNADPRGALRALREPQPDTWATRLTARQLETLGNQAQAEIDRREAQYRQQVSGWAADNRLRMSMGLAPRFNLSVSQVTNALGEAAGIEYAGTLQAYELRGQYATQSTDELVSILQAPAPSANASTMEAVLHAGRVQAAQAELQSRTDPATYGQTNRLFAEGATSQALGRALQSSDPGALASFVVQRTYGVGQIVQNGRFVRTQDGPTPLLSEPEREQLRTYLDGLSPVARGQVIGAMRAQAQAAAPTYGGRAVDEIVQGLYADRPTSQIAGALAGRSGAMVQSGGVRVTAEQAATRFEEGARLLESGGGQSGEAAAVTLPSLADLRSAWTDEVGNAYAGNPQAEAAAFEAYRAYYASRIAAQGINTGIIDTNLAREAAAAASGGTARVGQGDVLLPWGMSREVFMGHLQSRWGNVQALGGDVAGQRINAFSYEARGAVMRGNQTMQRYQVMIGENAALDSQGRPVYVEVPSP